MSVDGKELLHVAVRLVSEACNLGEAEIYHDSLEMAGQAVGEDYESPENACPSLPAPFCPDESEVKSDAKRWGIQCEKHAQSAELETVYVL